jgi:hypothetical protein
MAKAKSPKAPSPRFKPLPPETRHIDLTKFKPDILFKDWAEIFKPGREPLVSVFFQPIETLSPIKTIGKGRTNLTLVEPFVVQTDTLPPTLPHANFDRRLSPHRNPTIQMHFQPNGYGITTVGTYIMTFAIEAFGASTFNVAVNPGLSVTGTGTRTLNGQQLVTLVIKNLAPAHEFFAFVEQTAGGAWNWFSTKVTYPPLVIGI